MKKKRYLNRKQIEAYNKAQFFYKMVRAEINKSTDLYGMKHARSFQDYYINFMKNKNYSDYVLHRQASKIVPLIQNIKKGMKILDAGCGFGSETILCGILGGSVLGVDLNRIFINLANKRLDYYKNKLKKNINIKFVLKNILKHYGKYDIIWLKNAISHITPPEKIIKLSYNNLKIGGKLIVSDSNKINPVSSLFAKRQQKKEGVYAPRNDPVSGEKVLMAQELFFTIPGINKLLSKYFEISKVYSFDYFPFFIFNKFKSICKIVEEHITKLPIINLVSQSYVIVATKLE